MIDYYDDRDDREQETLIKLYKNGDQSVAAEIKLRRNQKMSDIQREIEHKLHLKAAKQLRFFNQEGLEIFEDDLEYMKDGEVLFVSKGEDFDKASGISEYEVIERLGEGGFGQVELAIHRESGKKVAIKFLKAQAISNAHDIDLVFKEAEMLRNLKHQNIVKIENCFTLKGMQVAFVMEYLEGGELKQYVQDKGHLEEEEAKLFFEQLADAVYYCHHRENLIHRDLKLENILFATKERKIVKVVDFGIAGFCSNLGGDIDAGSLDYMAPELFSGKKVQPHVGLDVWSMGVILYCMLCGSLPFRDQNSKKTIDRIMAGKFTYPSEIEKKLSPEVKDFIKKCLEMDYHQRPNVIELMKHPWMKGEKLPEPEESDEEEKEKENKNKKGKDKFRLKSNSIFDKQTASSKRRSSLDPKRANEAADSSGKANPSKFGHRNSIASFTPKQSGSTSHAKSPLSFGASVNKRDSIKKN